MKSIKFVNNLCVSVGVQCVCDSCLQATVRAAGNYKNKTTINHSLCLTTPGLPFDDDTEPYSYSHLSSQHSRQHKDEQ